MFLQVSHRLTINLNNLERSWLLYEELGHHAHSGTNLQNRYFRTCINRIGYLLGDIQFGQEVLTEILLRSNLFHGCKDKGFQAKCQMKSKKRQARMNSCPSLTMLSSLSKTYFIPRFMPLFALRASAAQTATMNVIINNTTITLSFLLLFLLQRYYCLRTQPRKNTQNGEKQAIH